MPGADDNDTPDGAAVHVSDLPTWITPMQAVAWIATRNPAVALRASLDEDDCARAKLALGDTADWCGNRPGLSLMSIALFAGSVRADEDAIRDLLAGLQRGDVIASAIPFDQNSQRRNKRQEMAPLDWADKTLQTHARDHDELHLFNVVTTPVYRGQLQCWDWLSPLISTAGLLKTWPGSEPCGRAELPPSPAAKQRRTNGMDYTAEDEPLVAEMRRLISAGAARSPEDAARAVVSTAAGKATGDSKVKRLARRYRTRFPSQS